MNGMICSTSFLRMYQKHINHLAKKLGCGVRQNSWMTNWGMMYVEFGYVEGPVIKSETDYLVLLHELGHVAHGHTQGRPPKDDERFYFDNGVLKSEAEAWNWALDEACLDDLSLNSRKFMWETCLGSYYMSYYRNRGIKTRLGNGNRHHVEFVFDHPDSYFAETVKRIQGNDIMYNVPYMGRYDV